MNSRRNEFRITLREQAAGEGVGRFSHQVAVEHEQSLRGDRRRHAVAFGYAGVGRVEERHDVVQVVADHRQIQRAAVAIVARVVFRRVIEKVLAVLHGQQ